MLGMTLRTGWVLPVALGVWAAPAFADDEYAGSVRAAARRPWVSPPGWIGPGPAWHNYSYPGPGNGWQPAREVQEVRLPTVVVVAKRDTAEQQAVLIDDGVVACRKT